MKISPILPQHLADVGQFLHLNLNRQFSPQQWISSLTHPWAEQVPNHGMQLHDGDSLVGVFCAIYSDQQIDGRLEHFCNPHSWCVLDTHRKHGVGLVLQIIKQTGYHFTMFTPNGKVAQVFLGLKFKRLDDRRYRCFNIPDPAVLRSGTVVESRRDRIAACLRGQDLHDFKAHCDIPWLNFVVFGRGGELCWVVFKPTRWKRLPAARIMHVSDAALFARFNGLLRTHLLRKYRLVTMDVEARYVQAAPQLAWLEQRTPPKLFLSKTLDPAKVRDLYSELMSLDV